MVYRIFGIVGYWYGIFWCRWWEDKCWGGLGGGIMIDWILIGGVGIGSNGRAVRRE